MADFDDLIPKSSNDNPFENPFVSVGRPRSPDPWSLGASYYEQPHSSFESSADFDGSYIDQRPSPQEASISQAITPNNGLLESPVAVAGALEYRTTEQHDGPSSLTRSIEASPVVINSPPAPHSSKIHTLDDTHSPSHSEREPSSTTAKPDTLVPHSEVSNRSQPGRAVTATEGETSPQTSDRDSFPSSAISPQADLRGGSTHPIAHISSFASPATATWDPISQPPIQKYDSISSPLLPPDSQSMERSFNSLTLGGVAAGWGSTPLDESKSPSQDHRASEGEDEDDKPLGIPLNYDAQTGFSSRAGDGSATKVSSYLPTVPLCLICVQTQGAGSPLFQITVGDPQKVGDPINAHIVYTVSTRVRFLVNCRSF